MRRSTYSSLRLRLSLLILVSLLPAAALVSIEARQQRLNQTAEVQAQALSLAQRVSVDHEALIVGARQLLGVLARLPEIRGGDPAACGAFLASLLSQLPQYANFGLVKPDGYLVCSALPLSGKVDLRDRAWFRQAMATRAFAVGDYQIGRVTGKATINFGYPVNDDAGRIQSVVFAALDLAWLERTVSPAYLPAGSTLMVIDRRGTILARSPDPQRWVGRSVPEAPILAAIASSNGEGTAAALGLDGVPKLYGFTRLGHGSQAQDVYVSVGVPQAAAIAGVSRDLAEHLVGLGAFGLLALAAAWWGATHMVLRPVDSLVAATRRLSAGDLNARAGLPRGPAELNELAQTFDEMAASLQWQAIEREAAEAEILGQLETLTALYNAAQKLSQSLDLRALATDITRACVTFGATLAWLIQAEPDGTARFISHFPPDADYIRQISVRWDASPEGQGSVGRSVRTGFPVVIGDVTTDPGFSPWRKTAVQHGICCVASFPMIARDKPFGALGAASSVPGFFTPRRVEFFRAYANLAAAALENARLYEETQQGLSRLQALRAIDVAITSSLDLGLTLNLLLDQLTAQLRVDAAGILLLSPHTQGLEFAASRGFRHEHAARSQLRIGEGYAGQAASERRTIRVRDLRSVNDFRRQDIPNAEEFTGYMATPLIAEGQVKGVLEVFTRTPLDPNPSWMEFLETLAGQAAIAIDNASLFTDLQRANVDLTLAYETTLEGWSQALDLRDRETEGHTRRVAEMTVQLARAMAMPEETVVHVRRGSLLHDIGKMGIPDSILLKPGPLTNAEWAVMKKHPVHAYELLSPIAYLQPALDIPYCHHERDGTGYPRGLKGDQIPLAARIFAVADVWDALRSDRPYRPAWSHDRALDYVREQRGTHFDPAVADVFLRMVETFEQDQLERT